MKSNKEEIPHKYYKQDALQLITAKFQNEFQTNCKALFLSHQCCISIQKQRLTPYHLKE